MPKAPLALCDDCPLVGAVFVPTEYHKSKIILLAEAPGFEEEKQGFPLVGQAGKDLMVVIDEAGAKREQFILMNAVDCHPTKVEDGRSKNRTPIDQEIRCCNQRLLAEIDEICPTIIITLGQTPYKALGQKVGGSFRMRDVVGTRFVLNGKYECLVSYHPAAISYSGGIHTDMGNQIRNEIRKAIKTALAETPKTRQLTLF